MHVILSAEDDPDIRDLFKAIAEAVEGWLLVGVRDGEQFTAALDSMHPSLVLLDVQLPGITGIEIYRELRVRADTCEVPVLFVTSEPERVQAANLAGHFSVISKPFDLQHFVDQATLLMSA